MGWYQSTFLGAYMDIDLIQSQYAFQSETAESVVLVYDPERTAQVRSSPPLILLFLGASVSLAEFSRTILIGGA